MRRLTPIWRGLRVVEHVLTGAAITAVIALLRALGRECRFAPQVVCWWHRRLCRSLGLRVEISGRAESAALLVANHVSWLDIPVIGSAGSIGFLSKAEVRDWPLVGWMSAEAGTLFLRRGAHEAAAVGDRIAARIRSDRSITIFPEGTTSDGTGLLRFHPRLFAVVQRAGVPVRPVAIRYGSNAAPDPIAPFIGDDTLLAHLLRVLRHDGMRVQVQLLPELDARGLDRRALAEAARMSIAAALGLGERAADIGRGRPSPKASASG